MDALNATAGLSTSGRAALDSRPWGTSLSIDLVHLPANGPFVVQVSGTDGRKELAAAWSITPNAAAAVVGASSMKPSDNRTITVLDGTGHVIASTKEL